jgi:hypothetical protein
VSNFQKTLRQASFQNKEVFFCHGLEGLTGNLKVPGGGQALPPGICPWSGRTGPGGNDDNLNLRRPVAVVGRIDRQPG